MNQKRYIITGFDDYEEVNNPNTLHGQLIVAGSDQLKVVQEDIVDGKVVQKEPFVTVIPEENIHAD